MVAAVPVAIILLHPIMWIGEVTAVEQLAKMALMVLVRDLMGAVAHRPPVALVAAVPPQVLWATVATHLAGPAVAAVAVASMVAADRIGPAAAAVLLLLIRSLLPGLCIHVAITPVAVLLPLLFHVLQGLLQ